MARNESTGANVRRGPPDVPPEWNRVTSEVIAAALEVHTTLGPGLIEKIYEEAMVYELTERGLLVRRQHPIELWYKNRRLSDQYVDILVNDLVILELKSTDRVSETHLAQLVSYLRSTEVPLGLLINFNEAHLRDGIYRRVYSIRTPLPAEFHDPLRPRTSATPASSAFS